VTEYNGRQVRAKRKGENSSFTIHRIGKEGCSLFPSLFPFRGDFACTGQGGAFSYVVLTGRGATERAPA
jgi:hypothetical protein